MTNEVKVLSDDALRGIEARHANRVLIPPTLTTPPLKVSVIEMEGTYPLHRRPPEPGYVEVLCSACDPPSMVHVPEEWKISEPYICTCCLRRAEKRMMRASEPLFGRMKHGEMKE